MVALIGTGLDAVDRAIGGDTGQVGASAHRTGEHRPARGRHNKSPGGPVKIIDRRAKGDFPRGGTGKRHGRRVPVCRVIEAAHQSS